MQTVLEESNSTVAVKEIFTFINDEAFVNIKNDINAVVIDGDYLDDVASVELADQGKLTFIHGCTRQPTLIPKVPNPYTQKYDAMHF